MGGAKKCQNLTFKVNFQFQKLSESHNLWNWHIEICGNLVFCVNLGLLASSFVVDKARVQLNGKTLQVLKISLPSGPGMGDMKMQPPLEMMQTDQMPNGMNGTILDPEKEEKQKSIRLFQAGKN